MPLYNYECQKCGKMIEAFLPMSEAKDEIHGDCLEPSCKGKSVFKKQVSLPALIQFKGSGFYVNDYKKKENSNGQS